MRAQALQQLGLSVQDWGPCYTDDWTHAEFAAAWRGIVPCPTEPSIISAYEAWQAAQQTLPNWNKFLTDAFNGCCAVATGTLEERMIEVSRRMDQYPSFVTAAQRENLALLQVVIARAHADYLAKPATGVSPEMEAAIQAAMVANHLVGA